MKAFYNFLYIRYNQLKLAGLPCKMISLIMWRAEARRVRMYVGNSLQVIDISKNVFREVYNSSEGKPIDHDVVTFLHLQAVGHTVRMY